MFTKQYKRVIDSTILGRMAHCDVFELSKKTNFVFLLFGGSGIDNKEYQRRNKTVIPIFNTLLKSLKHLDLTFIYITAPFDIPFNHFPKAILELKKWNNHVLKELLMPWKDLPFYISSFSGGTALAFNGIHSDLQCFGGGIIGFDWLRKEFSCPTHWKSKLRIISAPYDCVCNHPNNRLIIRELQDRGEVEEIFLRDGYHQLRDYSVIDGLGNLLEFATIIEKE